jgi:MYXO-CTERM domain-containing protein
VSAPSSSSDGAGLAIGALVLVLAFALLRSR